MPLASGAQLDAKYRILRRLGAGGFGQVYLAEDELLGRRVAIKALHERDAEKQANLVHEMKFLDQLHHPNVISFHHHFLADGALFLVMEFCGGGSLRDRMRTEIPTLQATMQWGKELADTLHHIHLKGIVHHDIKPDNILFTSEDVIKIGDFGVANRNLGTIRYLAPEMQLGNIDVKDVRIDVYALGITLLELLEGSTPFAGMSAEESLQAKLRHNFIPDKLERWIQDLVSKATHPTPELRFQSMQEMREAIDSKHISFVFERGRVQAHALAAKAERLLSKKKPAAAITCINQALFVSPDCVSALIAAGKYNLFLNRVSEAERSFGEALSLNPRANIQKELGWLYLESGKYSQAISLLTDHLQRNASDYEAFNLLLECFFCTGRYEVGLQIAKMMIDEGAPSDCFRNNAFLCEWHLNKGDKDFLRDIVKKRQVKNAFLKYNQDILESGHERLKSLLLFQNYRFGLPQARRNTLTVMAPQKTDYFRDQILTIGRASDNRLSIQDPKISRYHCAIVNLADDVWVYDLGSTLGLFVDGQRVERKAFLEGVHDIRVGSTVIKVSSNSDRLL